MDIAIGELVRYLSDLAEINSEAASQLKIAITSQYKEIRAVKTGVNLEVEDIDEERIRTSIIVESSNALSRSDSKMFGDSTNVLIFQSDFEELRDYWEESMEEQRHSVEQHEAAADQFKLQAEAVKGYFDEAKAGLSNLFMESKQLGSDIEKVQAEVDLIKNRIKMYEEHKAQQDEQERLRREEEEKLREAADQQVAEEAKEVQSE